MSSLDPFKQWYATHQKTIFKDFFDYLRFPSVSSEAAHKKDMLNCAHFLVESLKEIGLEVELHETSHHPFVFASHCHAPKEAATLLIYLHYDVQPVDPIELWDSKPFEPEIRGGKIFARGASDNKGQGFYTITALKAFLEKKQIKNFNLKILIEGEEEIGSTGLMEELPKLHDLLKADYLLVIDSSIDNIQTPLITLGMRGVMTFDLECITAIGDIHSGWGGVAPNSIKVLISVLSKAYNDQGQVQIEGFYDDVHQSTDEEKRLFFSEDYDKEELKEMFGIEAFSVEEGYTFKESSTMRPTFEINGIWGGYQGDGFKTVIPAKAQAKISIRTVPNQDTQKLEASFRHFLSQHMPKGVQWKLIAHGHGPYYKSDIHSPIVQIAREAYSDVFEKPCQFALIGGSVPITAGLCKASGADAVAIGTATHDNQYHAPNEFFYLDSFEKGFLTIVRILDILES
ncbi:MAG: dipeptidase [Simkaniaceae bacterium]|nr:dipeptidase [Simkaniaceae bacterium]